MGTNAGGTILESISRIAEAAAALIAQCIQRTIAEQTIEAFFLNPLVTRKELTVPVLKKLIVLHIFLRMFLCYDRNEVTSMRILIDADGCPVTDIAIRVCREFGLPCLLLCDTAHILQRDGAQTLVFDKGADSVDYALVNRVQPGDAVITQDYGLASMCLAKKCRILHQDGWEYTRDNIDALLLVRHASRKHRASGGRFKGPQKRTPQQNAAFEQALRMLLQTAVQG